MGSAFLPLRAVGRQSHSAARAALPREPVPGVQPGDRRRPRLHVRAACDDGERLLDLGTKGSGQTPYSRHADGRLTLKGGVREVLATEMLEALGVNTSKSFALFETGESLERGDEPSPTRSAVLTRLSHGHIRIGTFQRFAFLGETDNLRKLVRYCLDNLYGEPGDDPLRLFDLVSPSDRDARCLLPRGRLRSRRAQQRQYQRYRRSFDYGRGASRQNGTRTSPRRISTITASIPSLASPRRSIGTWPNSEARCR